MATKQTNGSITPIKRTALQEEIAAVFRKVKGGSYQARKETRLELLQVAMEECGITQSVIDAVITRVRVIAGMGEPARILNDRELVAALRDKVSQIIPFIDPVVLAQSSSRDLAITLGILVEKHELLQGKPTSITRHDMQHISELMPALIKEAQHRGFLRKSDLIELSQTDYVAIDRP